MTSAVINYGKSSLFSKVSLLLYGTFIVSALGTLAGAGITSTGTILVLAILFLAGAIVVPLLALRSAPAGVVALAAWTFISGLFLGPCIQQYVAVLGWQTVFLTYLGTGGVMAVCGAIGVQLLEPGPLVDVRPSRADRGKHRCHLRALQPHG